MKRVAIAIVLVLSLFAIPAVLAPHGPVDGPVDTALAQEDGDGADEAGATGEDAEDEEATEEGGLEGAIEGFIEERGLLTAVFVLVGAGILLTVAAERLISYLIRVSLRWQVSLFSLAILFTGFEFDDTVLAIVFSAGGLEQVALGTALGTGLAILGITLALAAIISPFSVDLPTDYVVLFAAGPIVLVPFAFSGTLSIWHGVFLTGFFLFVFGYFVVREYQRDVPVFRTSDLGKEIQPDGGNTLPASVSEIPEDRLVGDLSVSGWLWLLLSILSLVGLVLASMLLETSSGVVVERFGLEGTVFGATVLTFILTFEDVMLTIEPVRRGVPEIGVGNVIGSVLFSVTGNIGVILILSDLQIGPLVPQFHLPAILVLSLFTAYFFYRGELKRWHGYLLGGLYVAYWLIALGIVGGVPLGG
jgi:cation:H+ antiporter